MREKEHTQKKSHNRKSKLARFTDKLNFETSDKNKNEAENNGKERVSTAVQCELNTHTHTTWYYDNKLQSDEVFFVHFKF